MNRLALTFLVLSLVACSAKKNVEEDTSQAPDQKKAAIQYEFARESYLQGDMTRAMASITEAQRLDGENIDIMNLKGLVLFRQGKLDLAEKEFKKAIEKNPKQGESLNNLGALYLEKKDYANAKKVLLKGLENPLYLFPERVHNNLGLAYEGLKDFKAAEEAFLDAIRVREDFYLSYQNLGRMLLERGNSRRAIAYLTRASEICADCSEPRYYLAKSFLKENKLDRAFHFFQEGANLDPKGYFGRLCQQYLVDSKKQ